MNRPIYTLFLSISLLANSLTATLNYLTIGNLDGYQNTEPMAVSDDGSTVIGNAVGDVYVVTQGFRWTQSGGIQALGFVSESDVASNATGINGNGSVATGTGIGGGTTQAYRWNSGSGMTALPMQSGYTESQGFFVSSDGTTFIGKSFNNSTNTQAVFRWNESTGMTTVTSITGASSFVNPHAISSDGSIVYGSSFNGSSASDWKWTESGGLEVITQLDGTNISSINATSGDGSILVGELNNMTDESYLYKDGAIQSLGLLPVGNDTPYGGVSSEAIDVNDDGTVVVGLLRAINNVADRTDFHAFVWDEVHGMREISAILIENGYDVSDYLDFYVTSISADGSVITGSAVTSDYVSEGWVITGYAVPEPEHFAGMAGLALFAGSIIYRCRRQRAALLPC